MAGELTGSVRLLRRRARSRAVRAELLTMLRGEPFAPVHARLFLEVARTHGLIPLVEQAVRHGRWDAPPGARSALEAMYVPTVLSAALTRGELHAAGEAIVGACGVTPLVVKGAVVAERLYADRRLRPYGDIDVLVPRTALRPAVHALLDSGWELASARRSYAALGEPFFGFAEDYGHELHLVRRVGRRVVHLEVHWRVGDDPSSAGLTYEALIENAVPVAVPGAKVLAPSPADELVVLAVHLLHHGRDARLIWHVDLATAARTLSDDEWSAAFAAAGERGLGWPLHRALDLMSETTGVDRPRPEPAPEPLPWGPLRAADALPPRLAEHVGRVAPLTWPGRARYARRIGAATARRILAARG